MTTTLACFAIGLAFGLWAGRGEYRAWKERKRLEEQAEEFMESFREHEGR